MADNGTAASGPTIAWDDILGIVYQRIKLVFGIDGTAVDVSPANPLPVINPDTTATGSIAANGASVSLALDGDGAVGVQISGTWTGTLQFEATIDGVTWYPVNAARAGSSFIPQNTTVNGIHRLTPAGLSQVRVTATAWGTGTATITIRATLGTGGTFFNQVAPTALTGFNPTYRLFIPAGAAGTSKVYFDLFNATGSGKTLRILSVNPIVSGAVAVVGAVAVDLFLTRTSAIGTGGTAATADGASLTAATLTKMNPNDAVLPAGVTARLAPTAGATAGAVVAMQSVFTEETSAATYQSAMMDFIRRIAAAGAPHLVVPENTGIRIVQGAVASVGNIGFDVIFEVV